MEPLAAFSSCCQKSVHRTAPSFVELSVLPANTMLVRPPGTAPGAVGLETKLGTGPKDSPVVPILTHLSTSGSTQRSKHDPSPSNSEGTATTNRWPGKLLSASDSCHGAFFCSVRCSGDVRSVSSAYCLLCPVDLSPRLYETRCAVLGRTAVQMRCGAAQHRECTLPRALAVFVRENMCFCITRKSQSGGKEQGRQHGTMQKIP